MKKFLVVVTMLTGATVAQAKSYSCDNDGQNIKLVINEAAHTIEMTDPGDAPVKYTIYDTHSYAVEQGIVNSYSVKDGKDKLGVTYSGTIAVIDDAKAPKAAMTLLNDALGKTTRTIDSMDCKAL